MDHRQIRQKNALPDQDKKCQATARQPFPPLGKVKPATGEPLVKLLVKKMEKLT